eukprot:321415-Amphidinium_carterae.1
MPPTSAPYRPTLYRDLTILALLFAGNPSERARFMDCLKVITRLRCTGHLQAAHWVSTPRSR